MTQEDMIEARKSAVKSPPAAADYDIDGHPWSWGLSMEIEEIAYTEANRILRSIAGSGCGTGLPQDPAVETE